MSMQATNRFAVIGLFERGKYDDMLIDLATETSHDVECP